MKTLMMSLVAACAIGVCSTASAGVFVHAGPVNVAVGRPAVRHYVAPRVIVGRPVVVAPAPVVVPAPVRRYPGYWHRGVFVAW